METKQDLINIIKNYNPNLSKKDKDLICLAYDFASEKHKGQKRASGEDYFTHPLTVAVIAAREYELDPASIISALLHDVVEDTETPISTIEKLFGTTVANLVDGLTKLRSLKITNKKIIQAENYRKFVISISKDIRVLVIKLLDRYHNISTLQGHKNIQKRQRIALETLTIYVPLAERMGMDKLKSFMENICFKELYPQEYHYITEKLETFRKSGTDLIEPIIDELSSLISKYNIGAQIYGREKSPYSIWKKINNKNTIFDNIFDIIAFRFIVETIEDCYKILGILHSNYRVIPKRFKDYISTPKPNRYQSLHTAIIGPLSKRIEIQIRTIEMDKVAQYGYAAHWIYKQSGSNPSNEAEHCDWLRNMVNAITHVSSSDEIIENTKLSTFIDSIFCFTPMGDLWDLPQNSTALDFAYRIHSNIGNHCVGAKINKVIKNIRTPLKNGDMVEILTSPKQHPSPEWLRFVITDRAKKALKHYFHKQKKQQLTEYGKQLLQDAFTEYKINFNEKLFLPILNKYGADNIEDLYLLIGSKEYRAENIIFTIYPELKDKNTNATKFKNLINDLKPNITNTIGSTKAKLNLSNNTLANIPILFAKCCYPIPGDEIVGIIHTGKGISIHRHDCPSLKQYKNHPEKLFTLNWDDYNEVKNSTFRTKISILANNEAGTLNKITTVFLRENINIEDIKILNKTEEFVDILFTIDVKNINQLNSLINNLKNIKIINTVIKCNN